MLGSLGQPSLPGGRSREILVLQLMEHLRTYVLCDPSLSDGGTGASFVQTGWYYHWAVADSATWKAGSFSGSQRGRRLREYIGIA